MQLIDRLRVIPLFEGIALSIVTAIVQRGITKKYKKGEMILFEGMDNHYFYVILDGEVKVTKKVGRQKELILSFLMEDEHFGEVSLFDGSPSIANVMASKDCTLFLIDRNEILNIMSKNPDLTINLILKVGERLRETNELIKTIMMQPAEGKVAYLLFLIAEKMGRIKNQVVEINEYPSQKDMAGMLGVARETISRQMRSFYERELVARDKQTLKILDYERFKKLFN